MCATCKVATGEARRGDEEMEREDDDDVGGMKYWGWAEAMGWEASQESTDK
jgi:hypothetical protein